MTVDRVPVASNTRTFTFNMCLHWERGNKGKYIGLLRIWEFELFLWFKNDGDHGFLMWLFFRCGWYPVKPKEGEVGPYTRKMFGQLTECN